MTDETRHFWRAPLLGVILLAFLGCNNTPTVPLPPPDVTVISSSEPDENGVVIVTGDEEAAEPESIVLLYNDTTKAGVMEPANAAGAFEAAVPAEAGDVLVLRYMIDDEISYKNIITIK